MEQTDLLTQAINLTLFGMGFVFLFLILLVFITKLMSVIMQAINTSNQNNNLSKDDKALDEETQFVIKQAIKLHRKA